MVSCVHLILLQSLGTFGFETHQDCLGQQKQQHDLCYWWCLQLCICFEGIMAWRGGGNQNLLPRENFGGFLIQSQARASHLKGRRKKMQNLPLLKASPGVLFLQSHFCLQGVPMQRCSPTRLWWEIKVKTGYGWVCVWHPQVFQNVFRDLASKQHLKHYDLDNGTKERHQLSKLWVSQQAGAQW